MILRTPNGAVLEIFWRQRGVRPWSQVTAFRYLSRFRSDREGLKGLRSLLADRVDAGQAWRLSDQAILQRSASLIATGRVLIAHYEFSERWPGSGFVLGSGWDAPLLFWRDQLSLHRDLHHALRWIGHVLALMDTVEKNNKEKKVGRKAEAEQEELAAHKREVVRLRTMTHGVPGVPDFTHLDDVRFLQQMAALLKSRDLIPIYHRLPMPGKPIEDDLPPAPLPQSQPSSKTDPPDDPSFPPDHDGPQQAQCMCRASKDGTPFVTLTN